MCIIVPQRLLRSYRPNANGTLKEGVVRVDILRPKVETNDRMELLLQSGLGKPYFGQMKHTRCK
jgi:hypothetical protein